ncbi:MAG: polysaccharide pyruvyl transferase CsaB [Fimbriimonadales bacterium]
MKIVLAGYYGCRNIGDDALMLGLLTGLGETSVQVTALSGNPEFTSRMFSVRAVPRKDLGAIRTELETADALVLGGGGLLQDKTSLLSLKYYTHLIHLAKGMGKKVALIAQGIGPIDSYFGKRAAAKAFALCDLITVRDSESLSVAQALGAKRVELTADLAWLVRPSNAPAAEFGMAGMKSVAISARPWNKDKRIAGAFGGFGQTLFKNNYIPVLVEMDRGMDTEILDQIGKLHGGRCPDIRNVESPADMVSKIGRMNAVVSMRLHAGIFAASAGIAPMMVAYDPKVASFAHLLGLPAPLTVDQISAQRLWDTFRAFDDKREAYNSLVAERGAGQRAASRKNVDLLLSLL